MFRDWILLGYPEVCWYQINKTINLAGLKLPPLSPRWWPGADIYLCVFFQPVLGGWKQPLHAFSKVRLRFGKRLYADLEPPPSGSQFADNPTLTLQLPWSLQTLDCSSVSQWERGFSVRSLAAGGGGWAESSHPTLTKRPSPNVWLLKAMGREDTRHPSGSHLHSVQ